MEVFYVLANTIDDALMQRLDLNSYNVCHVDSWTDQGVYERLGFLVTAKVRAGQENPMTGRAHPNIWLSPQTSQILNLSGVLRAITVPDFAPEVVFEGKASAWSDIWALGCTIFEIRAGFQLLESFLDDPDDVIRQMVHTLGKLPEPWWSAWNRRHDYFDEYGSPKIHWPNDIPLSRQYPLIQNIRDIGAGDIQSVTDEVAVEADNVNSNDGTEPEAQSMFELNPWG
ncbi:hypothetical protein V1527DRAFT_455805 [Lipomyces starkeyi]